MPFLYVALGGAVGSVARYTIGALAVRHATPQSTLGTFLVNVIGCFLFGIIEAAAERRFTMNPAARAFLLFGVLGGFTTFSSYTYETFALLRDARFALAAFNAAGQVLFGMLALWAGYAMVRAV